MRWPWVRVLALALLVGLLGLTAPPVLAMDKVKAAAATAQQAAAALQRGDHKQAAHFYLEAYKLDPGVADYLYGAARETQAVGDADRAEELYGQYLALSGTDPKRTENAKRFIGELRADSKAREAELMRTRGNGALAAKLYREAWNLDPTRTTFLVRGARAAQDAQDEALAAELLKLFLDRAPASDANRAEAQARLESLQPKRAAPPPDRVVAKLPVETPRAPAVVAPQKSVDAGVIAVATTPAGPSRTPAWIALGSGGALAIAGIGIWASTLGDRSSLEAAVANRQNGLVAGISLADAKAQNQSIVTRNVVAGVVGGVGVAALGVGAWLWISGSDSRVTIVPTGSGATLLARW